MWKNAWIQRDSKGPPIQFTDKNEIHLRTAFENGDLLWLDITQGCIQCSSSAEAWGSAAIGIGKVRSTAKRKSESNITIVTIYRL